jgi:hypothetical protein
MGATAPPKVEVQEHINPVSMGVGWWGWGREAMYSIRCGGKRIRPRDGATRFLTWIFLLFNEDIQNINLKPYK